MRAKPKCSFGRSLKASRKALADGASRPADGLCPGSAPAGQSETEVRMQPRTRSFWTHAAVTATLVFAGAFDGPIRTPPMRKWYVSPSSF